MNLAKPSDPFDLWKSFYDQAESFWSKVIDENVATEEFSKGLGRVLDMNLQYKKLMNDSTKTYLEQMNMPSKDEVGNLASLVINLEEKVDNIDDQLEQISELKALMLGINEKLDQLLNNQEK